MAVVGTELKVLRAVAELKAADSITIARRMGFSSHYVEYLAKNLSREGYLTRSGRKFSLTPEGEWLLEKKAEAEGASRAVEE